MSPIDEKQGLLCFSEEEELAGKQNGSKGEENVRSSIT